MSFMSAFPSTVEYRPQEEAERLNQSYNPIEPKFMPYPSASRAIITKNINETSLTGNALNKSNSQSAQEIQSIHSQRKPIYKSKRIFKVIIIGDAGVGKTCLSFRFCNGRFPVQTEATIGVDFRERSLVIDGELIRVQLWDTAGQERYRQSIVAHYYRNVHAVVFVYDVNNPSSFKSLTNWISECQRHAVSLDGDIPHILIGNKCDLTGETARVKTDEAQKFADKNDMPHFETSALSDSEADHVESIFMTVVHRLRLSKTMHVQSNEERNEKEQRLLLKAGDAVKIRTEDASWCC